MRAAGVDRGTWHLMAGQPYLMRILGFGSAGRRTRSQGWRWPAQSPPWGRGVTRFRAGDEVSGIARGSFAHYAAAREGKLARKPARVSFEQAAAVAVSGLAALQGLRAGRIQAGQKVLVIGAGPREVSAATPSSSPRPSGPRSPACAAPPKVGLVRSIGADHVIDYTREDFADGRQRYDLILDTGGNSRLSRLRRALTPRGTLVIAASKVPGGPGSVGSSAH